MKISKYNFSGAIVSFLWITGIFTCSVSKGVSCFIGIICVTGTVDSLACSGLLCLVVASLILAACFPQVWGRFISVEIGRSVYCSHQNKPSTITKTNMYISLLKSARGMGKRDFSLPSFPGFLARSFPPVSTEVYCLFLFAFDQKLVISKSCPSKTTTISDRIGTLRVKKVKKVSGKLCSGVTKS